MERRFQIGIGKDFDPELLARVEGVFHGENLLQTILHAHILVERALTLQIKQKLVRPGVLEDGQYGRWSFHQRASLYVGLFDPPQDRERMIFGLNRLRNSIAHGFQDEAKCVADCLPWDGESMPPDAISHVWVVTAILLFELGALQSIHALDEN